jgi:hypothetical protein
MAMMVPQPMTRCEHTQHAKTVRTILIWATVAAVLLAFVVPVPLAALVLVAPILAACALVLSSLTIQVTDSVLVWRFGPGLFHKAVPLAEISAVEVTRTRWLDGWGIHGTRRGWLYNVSGFGAVLVTRKNGKTFLLGTDEPERLRLAILEGAQAARPPGQW